MILANLYNQVDRTLPLLMERRTAYKAAKDYRKTGMAFVHIPRTAGLSLLNAVYGSTTIRHFALDRLYRSAPDMHELPIFTVSRNPWDRVVSSYLIAQRGGAEGGAEMAFPHRYQGREFMSFSTFVHKYLAARDVWSLDPVFRPQVYYVGGFAESRFDHVGRFEDLPATVSWLSETLGREVALPHANRIDHPPYQSFYDDATRRVVGKVYRDDVQAFGYSFEGIVG